jgi:hypothetical protein
MLSSPVSAASFATLSAPAAQSEWKPASQLSMTLYALAVADALIVAQKTLCG